MRGLTRMISMNLPWKRAASALFQFSTTYRPSWISRRSGKLYLVFRCLSPSS